MVGTETGDSSQTPPRSVTDGGRPSISLATPVDTDRLASFLSEYDDVPAFEVTYTDDGSAQSALLFELSLSRGSFAEWGLRPTVRCLPLDPGDDVFYLAVASLDRVAITEPPPGRYTAATEKPVEEARGFGRLAEADPDEVPIPKLLPLLEVQDSETNREALEALETVARSRPEDCRPAIPVVRSRVEEWDRFATQEALTVLRCIGEELAREIAPLSDELRPFLRAEDADVRREATKCIATIAAEDASAVVDTTPDLATIIGDRTAGLAHAVHALSLLSREDPDGIRPVGTDLAELIADESVSADTRLNATAALGPIVEEFPSVGLGVVEDLVPLLESENHKLRNNAVGLLGGIATVHSDAIRPYTDAIADVMLVDDPNTRAHATAALSRVADDFPDTVADLTPLLRDCLTDDAAQVRENACWALGYLQAEEAKSQLAETARSDEDEGVRRTAAWAVDRCSSC